MRVVYGFKCHLAALIDGENSVKVRYLCPKTEFGFEYAPFQAYKRPRQPADNPY